MSAKKILSGLPLLLLTTFLFIGSCARKHSSSAESSSNTVDDRGCLITNASPFAKSSTDNSTPNFAVSEITQTVGSDGILTGSFAVPSNGISFLLSTFKDSNANVEFYSLTDPDGIDILDNSSTPNLYLDASGSSGSSVDKRGYSNVLVPQSPSFSAKTGTWTFKAKNNDGVKLVLRTGNKPSHATILVQPYITGTKWTASDISSALSVMYSIYSSYGITLTINSTISICDSQFEIVSEKFTNFTTSALVSQGMNGAVNLFFIEDYKSSVILGNAAGIPGSMGIANSRNGVLASLTAHAKGTVLDAQLLGETAAHEMGHQLGLFHTTEDTGTIFDILSDTPECSRSSKDNDSSGTVSAEECDGFGGDNLMFWTTWSSRSRSEGKKQETLSSHQQHVLKYSPIAK